MTKKKTTARHKPATATLMIEIKWEAEIQAPEAGWPKTVPHPSDIKPSPCSVEDELQRVLGVCLDDAERLARAARHFIGSARSAAHNSHFSPFRPVGIPLPPKTMAGEAYRQVVYRLACNSLGYVFWDDGELR